MQYTVDFNRDPKKIIIFVSEKDGVSEMARVFDIENVPTEGRLRQAGIELIIEQERLIAEEKEVQAKRDEAKIHIETLKAVFQEPILVTQKDIDGLTAAEKIAQPI